MKKNVLIILALTFSKILLAQSNFVNVSSNNTAIEGTVGLGSVIAVVTSWERNKSILWAIFHGICGWLYVIYFAFTRED